MKLKILSFKDNALACYTRPFYSDTPVENVATQITREIVGSEKREGYKHKVLYVIGTFDDETAKIEPCDPELVIDCDEVLARVNL